MSLYANGLLRVVSDPELKELGDTVVLNFYGGLNEGKDKNGEYINNGIDCEIWGKQAHTVLQYVGKGGSFNASGTIRQQEWEDKETGKKRRKHIFKVQRVELLPRSAANTPTQATASSDLPF